MNILLLAFAIGILLLMIFGLGISVYTLLRGAPFVPTKPATVKDLVTLAGSGRGRRAVDLGAGSGRLTLGLARAGWHVEGIEINPLLVWWANARLRLSGVSGHAHVRLGSFWSHSLAEYDLIALYGIVGMMAELRDKIEYEARPEAVILSNTFRFPAWPERAILGKVRRYQVKDLRQTK